MKEVEVFIKALIVMERNQGGFGFPFSFNPNQISFGLLLF